MIKETTQIPANLVSGDDNNVFYLQLGSSLGKKNFPQEILAQLQQLMFTDCTLISQVSLLNTRSLIHTHSNGCSELNQQLWWS